MLLGLLTTVWMAAVPVDGSSTLAMKIDPAKSKIGFQAAAQFIGPAEGRFQEFSGTFEVDPSDLSATRGAVDIQAKSIQTGDAGRDVHLRAQDFFDVEKFPTIHIALDRVRPSTKPSDPTKVDATIRIKDKAVPLSIDVLLTWAEDGRTLNAKSRFTISRHKFGIDYDSVPFIPNIRDQVDLELDMTLVPIPTSAGSGEHAQLNP